MISKVLVPLDGSTFGEHALAPALGVALRTDATLCLTTVHLPATVPLPVHASPVLLDPMPSVPVPDPRLDEEARAQRASYLEALAGVLAAEWGARITTAMLDGPVAESLAEYAVQTRADLVVMSTHGRGGLSRLWLGSVAEAVVRDATVPVLVVRPDETAGEAARIAYGPREFHRVLVPLDGSALAEAVLEPTMDVVGDGAEWTLVRVVEPITAISVDNLANAAPAPVFEASSGGDDLGDYLESTAARLRAQGIRATGRILVHHGAAVAILEHAREIGADLVAMATHGRTGLRLFALGSVADKVLRGERAAVLLYRPSGER